MNNCVTAASVSGTQTSGEDIPTGSARGSPQTSHDEIGPSDSASQVGSQLSSTTRAGRRAKIAILKVQCNAEQEKAVLQAQELGLRQQRRQLEMRAELEAAMIEDEALEQEELELAEAGSGNAVGTSRACEAPPGPSGAIPIDLSSAHGSHSHPDTTGTPAAREGDRGGAVEGYGLITLGPDTQSSHLSAEDYYGQGARPKIPGGGRAASARVRERGRDYRPVRLLEAIHQLQSVLPAAEAVGKEALGRAETDSERSGTPGREYAAGARTHEQPETRTELGAAMVEDETLERADSSGTVSTSRARKAPPRPSGAIPIDLSSAHGSHSLPSTGGTPSAQARRASWSHDPIAREEERRGAVEGYELITVGPETQSSCLSTEHSARARIPGGGRAASVRVRERDLERRVVSSPVTIRQPRREAVSQAVTPYRVPARRREAQRYVQADEEIQFRNPEAFRTPPSPQRLPPTEPLGNVPRTPRREGWRGGELYTPRPLARLAALSLEESRQQGGGDRRGMKVPGDQARRLSRRLPRRPDRSPSTAASTRTTEDQLESMYRQQAQLIGVLRAPAVNLPTFGGDPLQYFPFIRAFEENVEKTLADNSSRLARLTQLCTGDAARVINCCTVLHPDRGYPKARALLEERFGDKFTITELWVRKLLDGGPWSNLREYADELRNCFETLEALGAAGELQSQGNLVTLIRKLPSYLQNRWRDLVYDLKTLQGRRPSLQDVVHFVERAAAVVTDPVYGTDNQISSKPERSTRRSYASSADVDCSVCQGAGHDVQDCQAFLGQGPEERLQTAVQRQLCFVCLRKGHITRDCREKTKCGAPNCGKMHATALHKSDWQKFREGGRRKQESKPPVVEPRATTSGAGNHVSRAFHVRGSRVALPLVPVRVTSPGSGTTVETYALLDSGSNISLCQDRLLQSLGVSGRPEPMRLTTLEKAHSASTARVASLTVTSLDGSDSVHLSQVYSKPELHLNTDNLVTEEEVSMWPHLKDLPLHHASIEEVTLLIGQDCPDALVPLTTVPGGRGEPYAVRTCLGWTVNGPVSKRKKTASVSFFTQQESLALLQEKVEKFWRLDSSSIFDHEKAMSMQDKAVLSRWQATAVYEDGHYTLPIPFRDQQPRFPDNREMAERRLMSLARKLQKNEALRAQYVAGMQELVDKGFAVRVPSEELARNDGKVWYLPHHPVINPRKEKPRIVFDCAAEYRGRSLNDRVLQGPDLTNKLVGVLTRFRLHPVALMADIEAMFHQVRVDQRDQDVLRFLWWPQGDLDRAPATYRMTVHLFGGTWSPSCCTYALHRTVEEHTQQYPQAIRDTVLKNFYVDDCLKSVATEKEAINLVAQLKKLVAQGGFNLTKWMSNRPSVLKEIPQADRSRRVKEWTWDSPMED